MKKKISRILSMVIVVGMMAAIPASTQILSGETNETADAGNLQMLILVNRLELSEEQMNALHDILTGLLEEKEDIDGLRAEFEDVMIEFNGTGEELDELLVTFREDQGTVAEALRESIEASLDEVRDLLSINQGIALREALPELLGAGASIGTGRGARQLENMSGVMEKPMQSLPMGRGGMGGQQTQRNGQVQSPMQGGMRMGGLSGSFDSDSMPGMMRDRLGDESMPQMRGERLGQDIDDLDADAMMEQMQDRFARIGDQVPEEMRQQLEERFGGALQALGERLGGRFSGRSNQSGNRSGMAVPGRSGMVQLRERDHLSGGRLSEPGDLFELLEQVADVLELKMEAME